MTLSRVCVRLRPVDAALRLAASGVHVFPIRAGTKFPLVKWGTTEPATTDPETIRRWWARWPDASIGVACGPSRLVVVDLDGPAGEQSWARLTAEHGDIVTAAASTGRDEGGRHLWLRSPDGAEIRNSAGRIGPGIDVRGVGGMVLAPPSLHRSGRRYQWVGRAPLAPAPRWLQDLAAPPPPAVDAQRAAPRLAQSSAALVEDLQRRGAAAALDGAVADISAMPADSGRNSKLNGAAYRLARIAAGGLLNEHDVRQALTDAAAACGLPAGEAARTINSGMAAGMRSPRVGAA